MKMEYLEYYEAVVTFIAACYETFLLNFILLVKTLVVILGVIFFTKISIYSFNYFHYWHIRERKLNQIRTIKEKLLQKLVRLRKPMENCDDITALSYNEVRDQLHNNSLQVIDLLHAYQAKALEVDRRLNCITDIVPDADKTALSLDSLPQEQRGRLHGIPLSVKECITQAGFESYFGCVSGCFHYEKETACIVEALEKEGMIPFARTTMSQGGMSIECSSPLFGETLNPHDLKRTSGGSSGGEGALIGGRGSIAGLGTDNGGSVRIPSSYCGNYCLKPTRERIGWKNLRKWKYDSPVVSYRSSIGVMSSDFDLLVDITRVLHSSTLFDLDDSLPRLPFNNDIYESEQPMKIGFYKSFSDNYLTFDSVPAVKRGVEEAKAALERRGHTVVEWEPPRIAYACDLLLRCLLPDAKYFKRFRNDELFLNLWLRICLWFATTRPVIKKLLAAICWLYVPFASRVLLRTCATKTSFDVLSLISEADAYKEECAKAWSDAHLDGLICPVVPFTAPLIGDSSNITMGGLYCNLFNFLDYPAGVVPVGCVNSPDIVQLKATYPREDFYQRHIMRTQSADSIGLPVGVQCVAKKWQDETALRLMREVKLGLEMVES